MGLDGFRWVYIWLGMRVHDKRMHYQHTGQERAVRRLLQPRHAGYPTNPPFSRKPKKKRSSNP